MKTKYPYPTHGAVLVSKFYGIKVYMDPRDGDTPTVQIRYGKHWGLSDLVPPFGINGDLPKRVHYLVAEWKAENMFQILENWTEGRRGYPIKEIRPLK